MLFNADLHIHGRFSAATSAGMDFKKLAVAAEKKGVDMLATGDCLHPTWLKEIKAMEEVAEGTFLQGKTRFVLTAEVEAEKRVHHLIFFPAISSVEAFIEAVEKNTTSLKSDGRPNLKMSGEEVAQAAVDAGAEAGPAHAFTPWTGMYAHFDTLAACYRELAPKVRLLELGLSANTDYGDRIAELERLTFLTNSDAHSPQPVRIGREFNVIEAEDVTYGELMLAIRREKDRGFALNVGLPPEEGKYNRTACTRCYRQYELEQVLAMRWRCACRGTIKKGVRDRALELGGGRKVIHPDHRPDYRYMIPLSEIVMRATGHSSPFTGKVRSIWESLVGALGTEIEVLMESSLDSIERIAGETVSEAIRAFREGRVQVIPGGGGKYGTVVLPGQESPHADSPDSSRQGQQSLLNF